MASLMIHSTSSRFNSMTNLIIKMSITESPLDHRAHSAIAFGLVLGLLINDHPWLEDLLPLLYQAWFAKCVSEGGWTRPIVACITSSDNQERLVEEKYLRNYILGSNPNRSFSFSLKADIFLQSMNVPVTDNPAPSCSSLPPIYLRMYNIIISQALSREVFMYRARLDQKPLVCQESHSMDDSDHWSISSCGDSCL